MVFLESVGIGVNIRTPSGILEEYPCPWGDGGVIPNEYHPACVTRYVKAENNAEYSIHYTFSPSVELSETWPGPHAAIKLSLLIDGVKVDTCAIHRSMASDGFTYYIEGARSQDESGRFNVKNFRFAPITFVDDADHARVLAEQETAKQLGVIEVRVFRAQWPFMTVDDEGEAMGPRHKQELELCEKSTKGIAFSHSTTLSSPKRVRKRGVARLMNVEARPLAVFRFKYKSAEALRHELIIPSSDSDLDVKKPKLEHPDCKSRAREAGAEVKMEQTSVVKQQPQVKLEPGLHLDLTGDDVVQLPSRKRKHIEVIDLTDD